MGSGVQDVDANSRAATSVATEPLTLVGLLSAPRLPSKQRSSDQVGYGYCASFCPNPFCTKSAVWAPRGHSEAEVIFRTQASDLGCSGRQCEGWGQNSRGAATLRRRAQLFKTHGAKTRWPAMCTKVCERGFSAFPQLQGRKSRFSGFRTQKPRSHPPTLL